MSHRRASVCLFALALLARAHCAEEFKVALPTSVAPPVIAPATAATPGSPAVPMVPTEIVSDSMEMVSSLTETTFTFRDKVTVTATNMKMTCDLLVVVAKRSGDPKATFGKQENFKSLVATGNVDIVQSDREATCQRAEVFPGDDKVVLTGNPEVRSTDGEYSARGPIMILHRGERRAEIVSEGGERPRIALPPLKDLGYDKLKGKEKERAQKKQSGDSPPPATKSSPPLDTPPDSTTPSPLPPVTVPLSPPTK